MNGHDLVFNNITGEGKLQGPIPFENKEDKMSGTAKEIIIKRGEYVDLMGPVRVKQDTTNMVVDKARYSYKDELVHVNTPVKFDDPVRSMVGSVSSATYSPKDGILRGTNFNMKEPSRSAKAQNIVLYNKEDRRLELVGNAYISSGADSITGPKIIYYLDTKDAETPTNSIIKYDQYTIKSTYGKVNKESGEVKHWIVGVDKDQYSEGVFKAKDKDGKDVEKSVILTSAVKRIDVAVANILDAIKANKFEGGTAKVFTIKEDGVGLPAENPNLSDDIKAKIKTVVEDLKAGKATVAADAAGVADKANIDGEL